MLRKLTPKYSEDFEKYSIPIKAAYLYNSDFVNRMQLIKN
jgi:hypothetical protein